jgi:uncharacterized protein YegP (UPF0339 family)
MKIVIFKSKRNSQWYFHFKADNGEIIAQSEGYINQSDCVDTVNAMIDTINSANYRIDLETKAK